MLLIGYGNPGRRDDGLGPAFAGAIEALGIPGLAVDADYQLSVEDAAAAAGHRLVVFADASVNGAEPWSWSEVQPETHLGFSTHSVSPGQVLALARELFGAETQGYLLGIRGYEFDTFGHGLSVRAEENLAAAVGRFGPLFRSGALEQAAAGPHMTDAG